MSDAVDERLLAVLDRSAQRGFIGGPDLQRHLDHARAFAAVVPATDRAVDLGSGGGLPGLVLAVEWPDTAWVLVDGSATRAAFLTEAVVELGVQDRVQVVAGRAELVGRDPAHRSAYPLVVARSFGPPAVVAECAAPLLAPEGHLVVSDPPAATASGDRWDHDDALAALGLRRSPGLVTAPSGARFQVLQQREPCPDRYPRRVGIPTKRPLF